MTPKAYCGDACRESRRYTPTGQTIGASLREAGFRPDFTDVRHARRIRADRVRLARLGACIGCGSTAAERASELATSGGAR